MRMLFLRHGQTPGNARGRYIGVTDEPLSEDGAALLKQKQLRSVVSVEEFPQPFRVFVSPMLRCRQSAALFLGAPLDGLTDWGKAHPQAALTIAGDLRECDFGLFENKNYLEMADLPAYQKWVDSNASLPFPGGESREGFQKRCCDCFETLTDNLTLGALFVVHGGTIMSILDRYGRVAGETRREYYQWHVKNAGGYLTEYTKDDTGQITLEVIRTL